MKKSILLQAWICHWFRKRISIFQCMHANSNGVLKHLFFVGMCPYFAIQHSGNPSAHIVTDNKLWRLL
jgi:hypothetical protein